MNFWCVSHTRVFFVRSSRTSVQVLGRRVAWLFAADGWIWEAEPGGSRKIPTINGGWCRWENHLFLWVRWSDMVFQWEFHHDSHAEYRPIEGFDSLWFTVYDFFPFWYRPSWQTLQIWRQKGRFQIGNVRQKHSGDCGVAQRDVR